MSRKELLKNCRGIITHGTVGVIAIITLIENGIALYRGMWQPSVLVSAALAGLVLWHVYPQFRTCFDWFLLKWPSGWLPSFQDKALKHNQRIAQTTLLATAILVTSCAPLTMPQAEMGQPVVQQTALTVRETPSSGCGTHVMQAGENLFRLGLRYGVSHEALAQQNGITNVHAIPIGHTLTIPCSQ